MKLAAYSRERLARAVYETKGLPLMLADDGLGLHGLGSGFGLGLIVFVLYTVFRHSFSRIIGKLPVALLPAFIFSPCAPPRLCVRCVNSAGTSGYEGDKRIQYYISKHVNIKTFGTAF